MKRLTKKKSYKKIALILSLCAMALWTVLGTGASLAWFTDSAPEVQNIFLFGELEVSVSQRLPNGAWDPIDSQDKIFDENALYEPGYVQCVYLKVENCGDVPFSFHTAVIVNDCEATTNVFGQQFLLQDYLRFGIAVSDTEEQMDNTVADRDAAAKIANKRLHNYSSVAAVLQPGACKYITLIVRMPEDVDNIANYRGDDIPKVELGITVKAEQLKQ